MEDNNFQTKNERDFAQLNMTDNTKSLLLFKKFYTDPIYRRLISEKFRFSYYSDYPISVPLSLMIQYYRKYNKIPEIELLKDMTEKAVENKPAYKDKLTLIKTSIDSAINLEFEAEEEFLRESVINFIASNNAYNLILSNIEDIRSQKDVSFLLKELSEIDDLRIEKDNLGMNYFKDFEKHVEVLANPEQRIPTGFDMLDRYLNGGWYKTGRMIALFMAPSHLGKSLVLSNLAVNSLIQGKFVVIISLEMSEHVYASRIDAHISKLDINNIHLETEKLTKSVDKFKSIHPKAELVIKEYAAKTVSARQIGEYLKELESEMKRKIDVIYLDYLTLLKPQNSSNRDNLYEAGSRVVIEARGLSYEMECPVISAVQGNRSTYNSDGGSGMEAVQESIAISQTADVMISLFQTDSLRAENIIAYEIIKNRLGGKVHSQGHFVVNYNSLSLTEKTGNGGTNEEKTKGDGKSKAIEDEFDDI